MSEWRARAAWTAVSGGALLAASGWGVWPVGAPQPSPAAPRACDVQGGAGSQRGRDVTGSSVETYDAPRAEGEPRMDGRLDDAAWNRAARLPFVDIEGSPPRPRPPLETVAKVIWDETHLYIGAILEEPHLVATVTEHDQVVFHDNDFEVFIDPDADALDYLEIEINALGTIWDLRLDRPYSEGGGADSAWEAHGMKAGIDRRGTLNDPSDLDAGWSVELAIPWAALAPYACQPTPPRPGDLWRINFSRVEWRYEIAGGTYRKAEGEREANWVWSPQGVIDMHIPGLWGVVRFTDGREQGAGT